MGVEIFIPKMGANIDSVEVGKVYLKGGDYVKKGEIIFEIVTDKATFNIESDADGKILSLKCKEGDKLNVLDVVGFIGKEGEKIPKREEIKVENLGQDNYNESIKQKLKITPKAKKLIRKHKIDISNISFERKIIREKDILKLLRNKDDVVIYGFGGHGKVIFDILSEHENINIIGFIDDDNNKKGLKYRGIEVLGSFETMLKLKDEKKIDSCIIAIGDNLLRERLFKKVEREKFKIINAIHPSACISTSAIIGKGIMIGSNCVINALAKIGDNSIINTASTIDHDCEIGKNVHIAPGAHLGGNVKINDNSLVGIGADINKGINVGKNCIIISGITLLCDVKDNLVVKREKENLLKNLRG